MIIITIIIVIIYTDIIYYIIDRYIYILYTLYYIIYINGDLPQLLFIYQVHYNGSGLGDEPAKHGNWTRKTRIPSADIGELEYTSGFFWDFTGFHGISWDFMGFHQQKKPRDFFLDFFLDFMRFFLGVHGTFFVV